MIRFRKLLDWRTPGGVLQVLAIALGFLLVLLTGRPSFTNASSVPREIGSTQIAVQQARSVAEIDGLLGDAPSPDREVLRIKLYLGLAIVAVYGSMLALMVSALQRTHRGAFWIVIAGVVTVAFSLLEHVAMLRLIDTRMSDLTQDMIDAIRMHSTIKWAALAATILVMSVFFCLSKDWLTRLVGAIDIAGGAVVIAGLFRNPLLPWGALLMGAAIVASAGTLKFVRYEQSTSRSPISRSV